MFKISAQLAKATNELEEPFGGMNMIFAGDFAQLQPVTGAALYSTNVGTKLASTMSVKKQEETISRALWHQITPVVILRENMRQKTQTSEDTKLCTTLENMRYKSCTSEDITFLRTRISGSGANRPVLVHPKIIQIVGLPPNFVPITRRSNRTVCKLWNDDVITISRNQVPILPNFAMTDYSAQGRTRPEHVVELNNCKNHQSYYTCLTRSANAEGTIILQSFDPSKIMGGAPGYIREEF